MHEYSIVQSLMEIIEDNAKRHGASKVEKVVVKIGILSGVEPHLLKIAFDTFKERSICEDAELELVIQPIVALCKKCGHKNLFEKNSLFFECQMCKEGELEIVEGEDMYLLSLQME